MMLQLCRDLTGFATLKPTDKATKVLKNIGFISEKRKVTTLILRYDQNNLQGFKYLTLLSFLARIDFGVSKAIQ